MPARKRKMIHCGNTMNKNYQQNLSDESHPSTAADSQAGDQVLGEELIQMFKNWLAPGLGNWLSELKNC